MIQNLIIMQDGLAIFNGNFGDCHKLNSNPLLVSAFFDALLNFSYEFEKGNLEQIKFGNATVYFYTKDRILFIVITDLDDKQRNVESKLKQIANLFIEQYSEMLKNYTGEITQFADFKYLLIERKITQMNCGKHSQCSICENKGVENNILKEILEKKS